MNEDIPAPPPTVYPFVPRKVLRLLLASLGFVAVGTAFLFSGSALVVLVGVLSVSFFGLTAVLYAGKLLRRRPELVLDTAGLEHDRLGRIAWEEIAVVRVRQLGSGQSMLELVLHDPAAYLARAPRTTRITAPLNRGLGFAPTNIAANTLPVDLDRLVEVMVRHHPRLQHRP
ncbi:STM3941 family protein [Kitasatospora sp. NPDC088391]|uniref:STM3941 family protein n=1 Tax=Kitasatospora sp. NPDC088391 TaxID=3364074 RepID=UPI0038010E56